MLNTVVKPLISSWHLPSMPFKMKVHGICIIWGYHMNNILLTPVQLHLDIVCLPLTRALLCLNQNHV